MRVFVWIALAGGLAAAGPARAQLVAKSPFEAARAAGAAAPAGQAPLEFLGYLEVGHGPQFRIHDPATKLSAWVGLNERNKELDVLVKRHERDSESLTVEHRGAVRTLAIRPAKVAAGGPPQLEAPPPPPASNVAPAVTQAVVVNPTPADEQRRLEAVAAEVARRRALREKAQQTVNQAQAAPAPALPPR